MRVYAQISVYFDCKLYELVDVGARTEEMHGVLVQVFCVSLCFDYIR